MAHATDVVRRERDSDLVLLPELWPSGAFLVERLAADAQPLDGPLVGALAEAARAAEVWLHGGSFVERATDGRLFNTSVLLDPTGGLRAVYRKVHLFGFRGGETTVLSAGQQVVTCETPFGTVGLATCYDLRFPELFRAFVDRGVTLCLVPSAWPERRIAHWDLLARARAVEDQVVLLGRTPWVARAARCSAVARSLSTRGARCSPPRVPARRRCCASTSTRGGRPRARRVPRAPDRRL